MGIRHWKRTQILTYSKRYCFRMTLLPKDPSRRKRCILPERLSTQSIDILCTILQIYSLLAAYLLAAYHTSIVGVTWTLLLLCQHPEEQQKVQYLHKRILIFFKVIVEVDEVLKGRVPDIQDLDKLEYLGQVIKESMRIYTPGPFAARLIEEETRLGDFVLPKEVLNIGLQVISDLTLYLIKTTLFYPLSVIHMGEKHWPQPTVFNPDRFSPTNIKNILPGIVFCLLLSEVRD